MKLPECGLFWSKKRAEAVKQLHDLEQQLLGSVAVAPVVINDQLASDIAEGQIALFDL